jgi:site-specific recombinase XerD
MKRSGLVANWLNSVAYSHSRSEATDRQYKRLFAGFTSFIGMDAEEIQADYEVLDDRKFGRKHAQHILAWIAHLAKERNLTATSVKMMVAPIKSFFK